MRAAATALVGAQFALGCAVAAYAASAILVGGRPGGLSLVILLAAYVPYAGVGSILVAKRPWNLIGWVLLGIGWTFAIGFLPMDATIEQLQTLTASPLQEVIAWLTKWSVSLTFALFAVLAFTFPTGRLAEGRWRPLVRLALTAIWGTVILSAFDPVLTIESPATGAGVEVPNPIGLLPPGIFDAIPPEILALVLPTILAASITAIAGRYARAQDLERLQLRWLVAAFGSIAIAVPTGFAILAASGPGGGAELAWVPAAAAFMLPPIAVGIAVTRYRLYEIDRLISRGLSWAILSGVLVAVYTGAVLLLQTALGGVIQGQTVAVAGSTLLAAALFQPLRRRVQAAVDHRFNRARYDAERTATDFADRLRDQMDLASVSGDIVGVVDTALRPTSVGVWIRPSTSTTP